MGELGNTPLMQAASDGDIWTIQILLEFKADPNALNEELENPLGFAVSWNQLDSIRLLVAAGADINDVTDSGTARTQLDCTELSSWPIGSDLLRSLGGKRYSELATTTENP